MTSELRTAGIVSRLIAAVIDVVIVAAVLGGGYLGTTLLLFALDVRTFTFPQIGWWFTTTGFVVASFLYLALCWMSTGRTIGAVMMGLRVVRISGRRLHVAQAVLRAAACVAFPIGLFWVVLSPKRLSLQDTVLRTTVVYRTTPQQTTRRGARVDAFPLSESGD
ncbi:RDD family protein [Gordonia phthalatica]|uniref:RDD family protein n=1 Tax=Gordonia phthalatica TaxID=1136941 RepID=UPI0009E96BA7|nr:RDD family protein [Gordonia phthalatica]